MEKEQRKLIRKDFNKLGIPLLIQQILLFLSVIIVAIVFVVKSYTTNPNMNEEALKQLIKGLSSNGFVMVIAVLFAFIPIIILRRAKFFHYDIKVKNKPITFKVVICSFVIVLGVNFLAGILSQLLELLLNCIGLTSLPSQEALDLPINFSMIFYGCIIAPFFEEFLYRGAILRYLEKYGAKFAIITSAILFGFMHANIIQIPFAIGIGMIFGFLAKEYSLKLSILIHMANNSYAILIDYLSKTINPIPLNLICLVIVISCIVSTIVLLIYKRYVIKDWLNANKIENKLLLNFFTSIPIVLILLFNIIITCFGIEAL